MLVYFFPLKRLTPPLHQYSQLELMLSLRKLGWSYTRLADHFNVPKTTIRYLCRKFGLSEKTVTTVIVREHTTVGRTYPTYDEERINPGKTYAEYLKEERERARKRLLNQYKQKKYA